MEFLGLMMQPSAVVLRLKLQPQEDWQRALSETTDKQPAPESRSPASPRGTGDQAKGRSRMHKGTPLAFKLRMLSSSDPVPFDPTLYSNRSAQTCLTSLMRIILPGQ